MLITFAKNNNFNENFQWIEYAKYVILNGWIEKLGYSELVYIHCAMMVQQVEWLVQS